jgi:hypothetical protein
VDLPTRAIPALKIAVDIWQVMPGQRKKVYKQPTNVPQAGVTVSGKVVRVTVNIQLKI